MKLKLNDLKWMETAILAPSKGNIPPPALPKHLHTVEAGCLATALDQEMVQHKTLLEWLISVDTTVGG